MPLPCLALTAILGFLCCHGDFVVALNLLVQFRSYLRPGACDVLRVSQLIAPTLAAGIGFQTWGLLLNPIEDKVPGKTGIFDSAVMLDTDMWLEPFYRLLIGQRHPFDLLWPARPALIV